MDLATEITIFVLAAFVGFEVISKVPTTLHTPLMSQTNAIHGIVMLGGLIVVGFANDPLEDVIGVIAIAFGRSTSSADSSSPTGCSGCSPASRNQKSK